MKNITEELIICSRSIFNINNYLYSLEEMKQVQNQKELQSQIENEFNEDNENLIESSAINELYLARDRLRQFANSIKEQKNTPLRKDVIKHCQRVNLKNRQVITFQHIEKLVKNRIDKMIKNKRIKKNWGMEDICILVWVISKYSDHIKVNVIQRDLKEEDWNKIAELIPGVKGQACMFKWLSLQRIMLAEKNWSDKESLILAKLIKNYGVEDWSLLAEKLYHLNNSSTKVYRCPKQCKERWSSYLKKDLVKGYWKDQQDYLLMNQIKERGGSKKWTEIAKVLHGRTQNALKNRFNLIIQKQRKMNPNGQNMPQSMLIDKYLERTYVTQFVENGKNKQITPSQPTNKTKKMKDKDPEQKFRLQPPKQRRVLRNRNLKKNQQNQAQIVFPAKIQQNHIIQLNYSQITPSNNSVFLRFNSQFPLQLGKMPSFSEQKLSSLQEIKEKQSQRQRQKDEMPDLKNLKVITIQQDECYQKLKQIIKQNQCSFLPYKYRQNSFVNYEQRD